MIFSGCVLPETETKDWFENSLHVRRHWRAPRVPIDAYRRFAAWRGHRLFPARYLHHPEALIGLVDQQRALGSLSALLRIALREQPLRFAQRFSGQARSLDGRCGYPSRTCVCLALGQQGLVGAL